jgi:hypothetical protein
VALERAMAKYHVRQDPLPFDRANSYSVVKDLLDNGGLDDANNISRIVDLRTEQGTLLLVGTLDSLKETLETRRFGAEASPGLALRILFSRATRVFAKGLAVIQVVAYAPGSNFDNHLRLRADWLQFPGSYATPTTKLSGADLLSLIGAWKLTDEKLG